MAIASLSPLAQKAYQAMIKANPHNFNLTPTDERGENSTPYRTIQVLPPTSGSNKGKVRFVYEGGKLTTEYGFDPTAQEGENSLENCRYINGEGEVLERPRWLKLVEDLWVKLVSSPNSSSEKQQEDLLNTSLENMPRRLERK